jgi:hypothetical protein
LYTCQHASCAGKTWQDARDHIEGPQRAHARQRRSSSSPPPPDADDTVPPPGDADVPPGMAGRRRGGGPSHAELLVELAGDVELFHTPDPEPFASILVDEHVETHALRASAFRLWLSRRFFQATGKIPAVEALQSALHCLQGKALFDGAEHRVFTRVGEQGRTMYVDCGDVRWMALAVDSTGWRLVPRAPIKFRRSRGMQALPIPTSGGSVVDLARFVNIRDEASWRMVVGWILAALRPRGPFPILVLHGEAGSAKTTLARALRRLVDPHKVLLRRPPRDERDLMITATNSWVAGFDNLSYLSPWLSDALCTLATGGGFGTRELYTDCEEILFEATRPIIVNGIVEFATRGDFVDRAIIEKLSEIPEEQRQPEDRFWAAFDEAAPGILGALLEVMVGGLRRLPDVELQRHPRMADFARWTTACEPALGWRPGTFMETYDRRRREGAEAVIEASPVAMALCAFMRDRASWEGTLAELLDQLGGLATEAITKDRRQWPRTPRGLRARLDRLLPELRRIGWCLDFYQEGHARTRKVRIQPSAPSASSAGADSHGNSADGCADGREAEGPQPSAGDTHGDAADGCADGREAGEPQPSADRPHPSARNSRDADGADDADGCAGRRGGGDQENVALRQRGAGVHDGADGSQGEPVAAPPQLPCPKCGRPWFPTRDTVWGMCAACAAAPVTDGEDGGGS